MESLLGVNSLSSRLPAFHLRVLKISNRQPTELESPVTYTKQTTGTFLIANFGIFFVFGTVLREVLPAPSFLCL